MAGTDKLGFRDIDIIKSKFPDSLFIIINNLLKIRKKIAIDALKGEDVFVAKQTLKAVIIKTYLVFYFIFFFNAYHNFKYLISNVI